MKHSPSDQPVASDQAISRTAGSEPIPGYRLIKPLGRGGYGDVWKCVAPGGLAKAIKFVCASNDHIAMGRPPAELELAALERFRDIRHPFLVSLDRIELVNNELVIVMELADGSLEELRAAHQDRGFPGIPREELLALLTEAADALDCISQCHQLQHLDIKPQNLLLISRHLKVADFGLVQSLRENAGDDSAATCLQSTPVYAAPETFENHVSPWSDQYSLAIVYMELLTGVRPFKGKNPRQLMIQHLTCEPDLSPLPSGDRATIGRALAKQPGERFPSCLAFMQALRGLRGSSSDAALSLPEFELPAAETPKAQAATPPEAGHASASELPLLGQGTEVTGDYAVDADQLTPPGYEFVEYLGQNPIAEVWRARLADGSKRLTRRLHHADRVEPARLLRLQSFRHPHVLPVEVVHDLQQRCYLVSPDYELTLRDRLHACRSDNLCGIPRAELIEHLRGVAAALDAARLEYGLLHLGLNPRRLVFQEARAVLADLGLIQLFWSILTADGDRALGRYDAPELIAGNPGPWCDQYSLALLYTELLTGGHPRLSLKARSSRSGDDLDLFGLSTQDREVIRRALHETPQRRWASCQELIDALAKAHEPRADSKPSVPFLAPAVWSEALVGRAEVKPDPPPPAQALQDALLRMVAGGVTPCRGAGFNYVLQPDGRVEHRFLVQLFSGGLQLRLRGFADQSGARLLYQDEHMSEYYLGMHRSLLQAWFGRQPGLRVRIAVEAQASAQFHQGRVEVSAVEGSRDELHFAWSQAPRLLAALRAFLQARPELRAEQRWPCVRPVQVYPLHGELRVGKPLEGQTRDLGRRGIGLTLTQAPPTERAYILLPGEGPLAECALLARIVRSRPTGDGGFDIGARFAAEDGVE